MATRLLPVLLALLLPLAGCGPTSRLVDVTDASALARTEAVVVGRQAEIALASGTRYAGRIAYVRPDSTAWDAGADLYVVATADLRSVTCEQRSRALGRGALVGAAAGFGGCFLAGGVLADAFGGDAGDNLNVGLLFGLLCAPSGALYGLLGGALSDPRTTFVFVPGAAAAGGPPEDVPADGGPPAAVPGGDGE